MATCYDYYRGYYTCNRAWNSWGRWVLFAVVVIAFIFFFFLLSCLSARRRRKRGLTPYYGTGWAGNTPAGHGAATYNPQYQNQTQPQSGYGNQQTQGYGQGQEGGYYNQNQGGYGGANQGYYGGQQTGATELQQPPNAYRAGEQVYSPPAGPPPGKDGVVR